MKITTWCLNSDCVPDGPRSKRGGVLTTAWPKLRIWLSARAICPSCGEEADIITSETHTTAHEDDITIYMRRKLPELCGDLFEERICPACNFPSMVLEGGRNLLREAITGVITDDWIHRVFGEHDIPIMPPGAIYYDRSCGR